jgi:hypothetical protein
VWLDDFVVGLWNVSSIFVFSFGSSVNKLARDMAIFQGVFPAVVDEVFLAAFPQSRISFNKQLHSLFNSNYSLKQKSQLLFSFVDFSHQHWLPVTFESLHSGMSYRITSERAFPLSFPFSAFSVDVIDRDPGFMLV